MSREQKVAAAEAYLKIAKRMGYAGIIGVLAFIPGINLAYVLAFANWPVLRELESLRHRMKTGRGPDGLAWATRE
jgi:hypothetical protein